MLKSELIRDNNVFNLETPRKRILAFITQGGHLSGKIMKGIEYRIPKAIIKLKEELQKDNSIGRIIEINDIIFVIYRKHYNSKVTVDKFDKFISDLEPELNKYKLKITNEDLPQFKEILEKYIPTIEYRASSEWPYK